MPALSARLYIGESQIFTSGSAVDVKVEITVHVRSGVHLGASVISLLCEERTPTTSKCTSVQSTELQQIPKFLAKGNHSYNAQVIISEVVEKYPTLLATLDPKHSIGIFWFLQLSFTQCKHSQRSEVIPVYPPRTLQSNIWSSGSIDFESSDNIDDSNGSWHETSRAANNYRITSTKVPFIVSTKDPEPSRSRIRLLDILFGERFPPLERTALDEVQVRARLFVPSWGVFQSPHKTGIKLRVITNRDDSVILERVTVKLKSITTAESCGQVYQNTIELLDRGPSIVLPGNEADVSEEIADLEIPPTCESTRTDEFDLRHEVRVTLVFRALHQFNMSRWLTLESPVNVLPSIIKLPAASAVAPPPYEG